MSLWLSTMKEALTFLRSFLRHPTRVGAIAPSSPALVRTMVHQWIDWPAARGVVEFGPGTGVFTSAIIDRLHADAKFIAIERCPTMAAATRARCPDVRLLEDSATRVAELSRDEGIESVDAIICGLPWASFPDSLQGEILAAISDVLRPGGQFATFAYLQGLALPAGRKFADRLREGFTSVEKSPTVYRNLPPAFVYRCVR